MIRANHGEVPPVQGGYLCQVQSLGEGYHGSISSPERKVRILADQISHPPVVRGREFDGLEVTISE